MDGIHDLGGKEGYGPVDVDEYEVPFHAPWEGRMWGISRLARAPDWTIDWWRHVRELIDPVDYLTRPYFDSWAQTHLAAFINSGIISLEEAVSGKAEPSVENNPKALGFDSALQEVRNQVVRFDRETEIPAAFQIGDAVRMSLTAKGNHTRLPQYVRGMRGVIHAHHGAHLFPDLSAQGKEIPQHLYSIEFAARDLWSEITSTRDKVYLDLWESYFELA